MRYAVWRSDNGREVTFDGKGPWEGGGAYVFRCLTCALGATAETVRAPRQEGTTTYAASLDALTVNLSGSMYIKGDANHRARAEYDAARSRLCEAFAPDVWGDLTYYRENGPVRLRCRPVSTPAISPPVGTYSTVDVDFVADLPYWESVEETVESIGRIQRFWRFPWAPVKAPMGAFDRFAGLENPTTRIIYPTVEVYTTSQRVTLHNRTAGKFVTIENPIGTDEKLVVELRDVTAWLWRKGADGAYRRWEDVSHWMSLDSDPWGLLPGYNQIVVSNDNPEDTPVAYVRYRLPVLGV